jgi:hypothetical protein
VLDTSQLASALLTVVFAAVMLVAGQQFIEYKSKQMPLSMAKVIAVTSPEWNKRDARGYPTIHSLPRSTSLLSSPSL